MIKQIRSPNHPGKVFEYHPLTGKVYFVKPKAGSLLTADGVCIAEHVDHEARAFGFVQTWLRGYDERRNEEKEVPGTVGAVRQAPG